MNRRIWLNPDSSASTGSAVAYHGKAWWKPKDTVDTAMFFEVSDCHGKVRLHKTDHETNKEFTDKLRTLASLACELADHIDSQENTNES